MFLLEDLGVIDADLFMQVAALGRGGRRVD